MVTSAARPLRPAPRREVWSSRVIVWPGRISRTKVSICSSRVWAVLIFLKRAGLAWVSDVMSAVWPRRASASSSQIQNLRYLRERPERGLDGGLTRPYGAACDTDPDKEEP